MPEEELKPCPFCGGIASWTLQKKPHPFCKDMGDITLCGIFCTACGNQTHLYQNSEYALDAWNNRFCTVLDATSKTPVCLNIIPTGSLKQELENRGELQELPEWLKEELNGYIQFCFENLERSAPFKNKLSDSNWKSSINAIRWVLTLKPPVEQEVQP